MTSTISARRLADLLSAGWGLPRAASGRPSRLAEGVRRLVAEGRLLSGTRLPSERELHRCAGRQPHDRLQRLRRAPRPGLSRLATRVRQRGLPAERARPRGAAAARRRGRPRRHRPHARGAGGARGSHRGLRGGARGPAPPLAHVGLPPLRPARGPRLVAARYAERGLATSPDQVILTTGALAGLSVALRALGQPGDRVILESPTYPNAMASVRPLGLRPVGLALDPGGLDAEGLEVTLAELGPAGLSRPRLPQPDGHARRRRHPQPGRGRPAAAPGCGDRRRGPRRARHRRRRGGDACSAGGSRRARDEHRHGEQGLLGWVAGGVAGPRPPTSRGCSRRG